MAVKGAGFCRGTRRNGRGDISIVRRSCIHAISLDMVVREY